MEVALAWVGAILGGLGLILAVVALTRTVPVLSKESIPGYWRVTNLGPPDVLVTRAFVTDEDQHRVQLGRWVKAEDWDYQAAIGMLLPSEDRPWCQGRILMAQEPILLEPVSVGRALYVKYRVQGFLGFMSRGKVTIMGGP